MVQFGDVEPFLHRIEDISPVMKAAFTEKKSKFKMELAVIVDYGKIFVKATYDLKRDEHLILH